MAGAPELVSQWRALVASHAAVSAALEHDLGERHGLGVTEFEVLERLAEDPGHLFRVQELAESVHLSQSALSRLIGRLERHGLVQRSPAAGTWAVTVDGTSRSVDCMILTVCMCKQ